MIRTISRADRWSMSRLASSRSWLMALEDIIRGMPTLMQKIRLVFRGWQRRREEREKEFLTRNAGWGTAPTVAAPPPAKTRSFAVDTEGLTVAYLDDSGQLVHFLDTEDGEIVDLRVAELNAHPELPRRATVVSLRVPRNRRRRIGARSSRRSMRRPRATRWREAPRPIRFAARLLPTARLSAPGTTSGTIAPSPRSRRGSRCCDKKAAPFGA